MRRAAFVVVILAGIVYAVWGSLWAWREAHVCPPTHLYPSPTLDEMRAGCVRSGGVWTATVEGGRIDAQCRPWLDLGTGPVVRRASR